MTVEENASLAPLTTFGIGGPARWLVRAHSEDDVREALVLARDKQAPLFCLGGGSNLLVDDAGFNGVVLRMEIGGILREPRAGATVYRTGAGENWDSLAALAVAADDQGIECLSGIPGTVGGVPVQNVGAYGQEASQVVSRVRAIERATGEAVDFSGAECGFSYRHSRFNGQDAGKWVITGVEFMLNPVGKPSYSYADLQRYLAEKKLVNPTLADVRAAVLAVRLSKGMVIEPPHENDHSAGSFFKNPVVEDAVAAEIPGVAAWPAGNGRRKLSAAWLVEHAGFTKGTRMGRAAVSTRHSLALVNRGGATCTDILALRDAIVSAVRNKFGVTLEMEPVRLPHA